MLTLLAASSFFMYLSTHPVEWYPKAILQHEYGHVNCPTWKHPQFIKKQSELLPPVGCRGKPKASVDLTIQYLSPSATHAICGSGIDGCTVMFLE